LLLVPPGHASRRAGLRTPHQRHRAGGRISQQDGSAAGASLLCGRSSPWTPSAIVGYLKGRPATPCAQATQHGASGRAVSMRRAASRPKPAEGKARAGRLLGAPSGQVMLASGHGATVALESIDGPPQPVFQKLVENLASEAVARQVMVISREATPSYRIRGYMAAHLAGKRVHIGWVWDVYDANKRRVLRIASEEPGGPTSRRSAEAGTAADEAMRRRTARTSMAQLAAFLDPAARVPAEPPAEADGMAVAATGDAAPVSAAPARASTASRQPPHAANAPGLQAALALA